MASTSGGGQMAPPNVNSSKTDDYGLTGINKTVYEFLSTIKLEHGIHRNQIAEQVNIAPKQIE